VIRRTLGPAVARPWYDFLVSVKRGIVLAKKTTKNQITLPKKVVARFTGVEYFDVSTDGECIILRPLQKSRAAEVRARLAQLGIEDVTAAVSWARKHA
jgi:aminoglycoside phosphotransferase family enzyme